MEEDAFGPACGRGAAHEEEVIPKLGGKVARGLERCFANAILGPLKLLRRSKVIRTFRPRP